MQFHWKLQLPTLYSLFRNLPCSTSNFLAVDADRIFVVLNIFGVSRTVALDILNVFCWDRACYWLLVFFEKLSFMLFKVRCFFFFILIHFLVVEDYELPKSTSHTLSVPLNLECVRILSWSISFFSYFNCLPDGVLCKISIWANDNTLSSSCDKPSDLSASNYIFTFGKLFYI